MIKRLKRRQTEHLLKDWQPGAAVNWKKGKRNRTDAHSWDYQVHHARPHYGSKPQHCFKKDPFPQPRCYCHCPPWEAPVGILCEQLVKGFKTAVEVGWASIPSHAAPHRFTPGYNDFWDSCLFLWVTWGMQCWATSKPISPAICSKILWTQISTICATFCLV